MKNVLILIVLMAMPQDRRPPPKDGINPKDVDLAIKKGVAFLKTQGAPGYGVIVDGSGLKLWAYIHAYPDILDTDPQFKELLDKILKEPLAHTYRVSLQAMCLEELDRVRYQGRIAQCAQALVDAQCDNGQWTYWATAEPVKFSPVPTPNVETQKVGTKPKDSKAKPMGRVKPPVRQLIPIKRQGTGPAPSGDNSNSQYAALGLRACHDAGIVLPKEVVEKARKGWLDSQIKGGAAAGQGKNDVQTGNGNAYAPPAGWGYGHGEAPQALGSMTAGAVGGLCIYDYILDGEKKETWKRDVAVRMGIEWLSKNFSVTENPQVGATWHYYYLYGLERAAALFGTETLGAHAWYAEGARYLLKEQKANGSWQGAGAYNEVVWDTCWAILFLRRATRPLRPDVATGPDVRRDVPQDR